MMRRGSKMSARVLTGSAAAVLLTGACMAAERKPYAEDDEVQPRSQLSPCSTRLALVRAARFDASASAEEVLESTLEAERLVGIEENVEILPGDGGGFLRVRYPEDSINFSSADEETPPGGAADRKSTRLNSSH